MVIILGEVWGLFRENFLTFFNLDNDFFQGFNIGALKDVAIGPSFSAIAD